MTELVRCSCIAPQRFDQRPARAAMPWSSGAAPRTNLASTSDAATRAAAWEQKLQLQQQLHVDGPLEPATLRCPSIKVNGISSAAVPEPPGSCT